MNSLLVEVTYVGENAVVAEHDWEISNKCSCVCLSALDDVNVCSVVNSRSCSGWLNDVVTVKLCKEESCSDIERLCNIEVKVVPALFKTSCVGCVEEVDATKFVKCCARDGIESSWKRLCTAVVVFWILYRNHVSDRSWCEIFLRKNVSVYWTDSRNFNKPETVFLSETAFWGALFTNWAISVCPITQPGLWICDISHA